MLILVWVIGVGYRWIHAEVPDQSLPPVPEPAPTAARRPA
jgi:hypothetical protein